MLREKNIGNFAVFDIFHEETECPVCSAVKRDESSYLEVIYNEFVLDVDFRFKLKTKVFCERHLRLLLQKNEKLGLAIMLNYVYSDINDEESNFGNVPDKKGFISRMVKKESKNIEGVEVPGGCIMCDSNKVAEEKFIKDMLYLWNRNEEFQKLFEGSKGFCLPHYNSILSHAPGSLGGNKYNKFIETLNAVQKENFKRMAGEIDWFIRKFDYRNVDMPWNNTEDAPKRAIQKIKGFTASE